MIIDSEPHLLDDDVVVVADIGADICVLLVSMLVLLLLLLKPLMLDNVLSLVIPFGFVLLGELNTLEGALDIENLLVGVDLG